MSAVIFDIDNCVADDGWRIPLIDWSAAAVDARYAAYHEAAPKDAAGNRHVVEQHLAVQGRRIVFLTARPLAYRAETLGWLVRHFPAISAPTLIMRNPHDHRPSVWLKRGMVGALPEYGVELGEVVGAFDDRPDVVDMYRSLGIPASVLAIHNICAYTRPGSNQ